MKSQESNLAVELFLQIFLVGRQIRKKIKRQSRDRMLNGSILLLISHHSQTVSSLAKTLSISLSTASEKINQLKSRGLLTVSSGNDKRTSLLNLTPKGQKLLKQIEQHIIQHSQLALRDISLADQALFLKILTKISFNLERI